MLDTDLPEFLRIVNGLAALKPGKPLTPDGLDLYWRAMRDWPLDEFKAAASHLATSCEFMPNPYHFAQLRKAGRPTAGEAWAKVVALVRRSDYANGSGDPLTDRAVAACGGFRLIGQQTDDGLPFIERRFVEHFEAMQDATVVREALPSVTAPKWLMRDTGPMPLAALITRGAA